MEVSGEPQKKPVTIYKQKINFNHNLCTLIWCRDDSTRTNLARASSDNKLLNLLTNTISHDMLMPLKTVKQSCEAVTKQLPGNKRLKEPVELVQATATLMLSQMTSYLDMTLYEKSPAMSLSKEVICLPTLITDTIETLSVLSRERDIKIHFVNKLEDSQVVQTDPNRVQQILMNLIANTI